MAEMEDLNELIEAKLQQKKEQERKRKKWLLLLLLLLLLAGCVGGFFLYRELSPKSRFELDRNALEGFLPGRTQDEIQAELNRIIDEGRVNISMNPTPVIRDGEMNVSIENVPANRYYLQADVYLYPEQGNADKSELVYRSGVVKPGFHIESGEVEFQPKAGEYDGIAIFSALDQETGEEIGKASLTLVITVE